MNFKLLKPLVPYLSVFIILLGVSKVVFYFNHYNVPVKYFINVSELPMVIVDDLILILLVLVIPVLIIAFFLSDSVGRWNIEEHKVKAEKKIKQRLFSYDYLMLLIYLILMICLIIWSKVFLIKSLAIYFFLTQFWPLLLTEIKIKYDKVNNVPLAHPYYNLALFSMMVIFSLTWFTIFEINNVDKGKYLDDYDEYLVKDLDSLFYVKDSWENFDKISEIISNRFKEWRIGHL